MTKSICDNCIHDTVCGEEGHLDPAMTFCAHRIEKDKWLELIGIMNNNLPETCDKCKLFVNDIIGHPAYCILDAEYTDEEIDAEEDGNLNMYYHGCLSHRPNNCPLDANHQIEYLKGEEE